MAQLSPGSLIQVCGWIRTVRESKRVLFVNLNDGSTPKNLQIVCDPQEFGSRKPGHMNAGAALQVEGTLEKSPGSEQDFELRASKVEVLGPADPATYPLQPKRHSLEFLRSVGHMRVRTATFSSVLRVRHALSKAIHDFFDREGFYYVHTPLLTSSDAEGAGEMFRVESAQGPSQHPDKDGFFGKPTYLTVSGQLEAELLAMGLSRVYTFGPTFRAEHSNTTRHLAEFWMIEAEVAFADIHQNMDLAEALIKSIVGYTLSDYSDDLELLARRMAEEQKLLKRELRNPMGLRDRLEFILKGDFRRVTYDEAFEILVESRKNRKGKFQFPLKEWGSNLQSEHECYLVEEHFRCPVIVYDYPKAIKSFYMRCNSDGRTVAAMDLLFPGVGEVVGGSQREERIEVLQARMKDLKVDPEELWWYLDTRRFGSAVHSGFGLGLERIVQFATGMDNIRDSIPFPRAHRQCQF